MGFRDAILKMSPPWLSNEQGTGGKFVYTLGLMRDALTDKAQQALWARMPGLANATALPYIGADRLIPQGEDETATSYGTRLSGAFDLWQLAAGNAGVLRQVLGFFSVYAPRARIVIDSSRWTSQPPGAALDADASFQTGSGGSNWNWDGLTGWWRWWLVIYSTATSGASWLGTGGAYADAGRTWGQSGYSWGFSQPSTIWSTVRGILNLCQRAGSWCKYIVVALDDGLCTPTASADGTHNPDGTWGNYGKLSGTSYVAARPASGRYVWPVVPSPTIATSFTKADL